MSLSRNPKLVEIAKFICRDLRKHSTDSEQVFWEAVRNRKFLNIKFYRQYPLFFDYFGKETFYVADFYCHENSIAVEIDGAYHKVIPLKVKIKN
jgi:very-short-patch-repair endonuclease